MLFPTLEFLAFFMIVLAIATILKKNVTPYKWFLLLINIIFYAFFGLNFLGLLVASIIINYIIITIIDKSQYRKQLLISGIIFNLLYLGTFKYYNFFASTLFEILNSLHITISLQVIQIIIPAGISFYTFRIISHLIDYYQQKIAHPTFLDYIIYITYFPQVLSGPICRAKEFYEQLNSPDKYEYEIETVILLILSGLFKKYTLSSFLFEFSRLPFSLPDQYSSTDLILAAIAYSCLIYVDFSGYSDLANAISSLLGFKPIQNFNMPYQSLNLQEFWHRWHISLSQWLKDYVYIPLGGNKYGEMRKYINLLLTMLIGGFWHGSGINFIVWGAIHGGGLAINHLWKKVSKNHLYKLDKSRKMQIFANFLAWITTFIFVTFSWIFFNTKNWTTAIAFIQSIIHSDITTSKFNFWQLYLVIFIILLMNFYGDKFNQIFHKLLLGKNIILQVVITSSIVYTIIMLGPNTVAPFIYFNF
jgi:alginate O-acetyltransferase complex protein AlgI